MKVTARWIVVLWLGGWAASVSAEELQWRAAQPGESLTRPNAAAPVTSGSGVQMGMPVALSQPAQSAPEPVMPVAATSANVPGDWTGLAPAGYIVRGQSPGVPPVPPPGAPGVKPLGEEAYNCGEVLGPGAAAQQQGGYFGNLFSCINNPTGGRKCFQSDHCFDSFISPVTNPFHFEDPRSLTELRPVFVWQQTDNSNPIYAGGDIFHFSLQGRLALTDWLSITIHKLGWTSMDVNNPVGEFQSDSGFSELWIGPKFTFLRRDTGTKLFGQTLMAAGLVFELPLGSGSVFQDTGWLSLRPYLSFGQQFGETTYGRFHFLSTIGYSFAVDSERSDYFFLSAHLDFDIGNLQKIYPFVEMNFFNYTSNGDTRDLTFEGTDLFNFGSRSVSGNSDLSIAIGARYLFTPNIQFGGAVEFPLVDDENMMNFRLVFDMIFRY